MTAALPRDTPVHGPMRGVTPAAPRRSGRPFTLRLWLPASILFVLLAPFAIAAIPVLWLVAPMGRRDWVGGVFAIGAALLALHGMRIDIRTPDVTLAITLF